MSIERFHLRRQEIESYLKILEEFTRDGNQNRLAGNIASWSKRNNRDPSMVYYYQMKIFKNRKV